MEAQRTSVYIETRLKRQLEQASARLGKTQTELVNVALEEYLANIEKPNFAFIGAGEDKEVNGENSEAWIHKNWLSKKKK